MLSQGFLPLTRALCTGQERGIEITSCLLNYLKYLNVKTSVSGANLITLVTTSDLTKECKNKLVNRL